MTPACNSLDDLARHLAAFAAEVEHPPAPLDAAMRAAKTKPGRIALGAAVAAGVRHMAHRFIAGESPQDAVDELGRLWEAGIASSVDLLGEATVTSAEADLYAARCTEALEVLAGGRREVSRPHPLLDRDPGGPLPRANLSVKVTALTPLIRPEHPRRGIDDAARRLRPLLQGARELGAHLHIDMESVDTRETTLELLFELLAEPEFRDGPSVGVVLQAYLRDSPAELDELLARVEATPRGQPLTIRLVKGAYWDHEVVEAAPARLDPPVFEDKERLGPKLRAAQPAADRSRARRPGRCPGRDRLAQPALGQPRDRLQPAGRRRTRRRRSRCRCCAASATTSRARSPTSGVRTRVYCPVGDLVAGMAYLVRRLLENTANSSFLADQAGGAPLEELLAAP